MQSKSISNAAIGTIKVIRSVMLLWLACCLIIFFAACSPADASNPADTAESSSSAIDGETDDNEPDATSETVESSDSVESSDPVETTDNNNSDGDASFAADDLEVVLDGVSYKMLENASDLLAALGRDFEYSEAESCVFEGMDKTFDFGDVLVYTVPSGDVDLLDGYDILGGNQQTAAGIGLGSTRDEVISAYGEPADDSDYMVYNESGDPEKIDEPRLTIALDGNGIVEMISYYSGSNAQG